MTAREEFWAGLREIVTLVIGVCIYGAAFGMLAVQAGFSVRQIGLMSLFVFAGSSQIIAAQQILAQAGVSAAIIAGLALNLRLLLITASIRDVFAGRPFWQIMLGAHLTTDESWAMTLGARAQGRSVGYWYLLGGGVCLYVMWCLATMAGGAFAAFIPSPRELGMDFAFTAAFIAIARSLWKGRSDVLPWLGAVGVVALCLRGLGLAPSWSIILGGLSGAGLAAVIHE